MCALNTDKFDFTHSYFALALALLQLLLHYYYNALARLNLKLLLYRDSYLASIRTVEKIAFCSTDFVWTINRTRQEVLLQLMGFSVPVGRICKGPLLFWQNP